MSRTFVAPSNARGTRGRAVPVNNAALPDKHADAPGLRALPPAATVRARPVGYRAIREDQPTREIEMQMTRHRPTAVNPWQELNEMRSRVRSLFGDPLKLDVLMAEDVSFSPAVEISETDTEILVTAELPGIRRENVDIEIENNVLSLSGEKQEEREEKKKETYVYERSYGSFRRSFTLPAPVDEENVKAEFSDGVLRIHLPKLHKSHGRKISIG